MFRNKFNKKKQIKIESVTGDGYEPVFREDIDSHGRLIVVEDRKHNLYESIQSHKDSCDIHTIISRFAAGDVSALNQREAAYFDSTGMPATYAELFNRVKECERIFYDLPLDVRETFNNSVSEFWSSVGSPIFDEKIGSLRREDLSAVQSAADSFKKVEESLGGDD